MADSIVPWCGSWFIRALEGSPLPPLAAAVCTTGALLAANLLAYRGEQLDLLPLMPCGVGYLPAMSRWGAQATVRDLRDLLGAEMAQRFFVAGEARSPADVALDSIVARDRPAGAAVLLALVADDAERPF